MSANLQVETVYLYPLENSQQHKTDKYEIVHDEVQPIPVLRRGKRFTLAIRFVSGGYDKARDGIRLLFNFGPKPNVIKGTQGIIRLGQTNMSFKEDSPFWWGRIIAEGKDTLTVEAFAPPNAPVGIWHLQVETTVLNSSLPPTIYEYDNILYILFNPWNCHDLVYMPDQRMLDEYILTDVGKVWVGPLKNSRGREWVFGQFDACVLPAAMLMFEKSGLPLPSRGDPIKVTRMISKMVNSNDDDEGILIGRWDGDYEDGTAPSEWTGSLPILQQYLDTQTSVPYGQCWVFSGVVATICRALGIPSRVVSNLVSAHDANASLTVDKYYTFEGEEIEADPRNDNMGEDSIWNYHVWNDVYMARPDLPPGYGGWQAIDATPQETSDSFYQCGPASLEAIKQGQVGFNYDVPFMVASVNADLMRWKEDDKVGYSKIYCNKHHIGRKILTKKPFIFDPNGDRDGEEVTILYKPKEGTSAERLSLLNAVRGTNLAKEFYSVPDPGLEDVEFRLEDIDKIRIGQDFSVVVTLRNKCSTPRHIKAVLSAKSVFYTGVKAKFIKKAEGEFVLQPQTSEKLRLSVTADEYLEKLVEYCNMKVYAIASVKETNQTWADEDDFQVEKPNIKIEMPDVVPVGRPASLTMKFTNPLKKTLTKCRFNICGPTLLRNRAIECKDVRPEAEVELTTQIVPKRVGEQKLVATFTSKELLDITGSIKIDVEEE